MIEQNQVYRKIVEGLTTGNDFEVEWMMQEHLRESRETLGWPQEQAAMMDCGIRWAVETEREEEQSEETRPGGTEGQDEISVHEEAKTGRGSASLVQGVVDGYDELDETRQRQRKRQWRKSRTRR